MKNQNEIHENKNQQKSQDTLEQLQQELEVQRRLLLEAARRENALLRQVLEGVGDYVDPWEPYREGDEWWEGLGTAGGLEAGFRTLEQLTRAREQCRQLAMTNEFAINGHENRISYIVGTGFRYRVVVRSGHQVPGHLLVQAQTILEEFLLENQWFVRQQEIVRRRDRDGEAFLRFFLSPEGKTIVRFVEPWEVAPPPQEAENPQASFGVHTDRHDVEHVLGYWIQGQWVPAEDIQHRKGNVDLNVKRGVPLFYPVRKNLIRAEKLLRNMAAVSDIQTAIALIRKHHLSGRSALEQMQARVAQAQQTSTQGRTQYVQVFRPGTILDVYGETEYDFPARGLDASRYVVVLQAILRAVASRLVMPEFMLTSDASNANYSSTLVAEGPAVKMFQRLQAHMREEDRQVMLRVLSDAGRTGRLPAELIPALDVQVEVPSVGVRDRLEEARVHQILVRHGAMSPATMALKHGLDPDQERRLIQQGGNSSSSV